MHECTIKVWDYEQLKFLDPMLLMRENRLLVCGESHIRTEDSAEGSANRTADLPLMLQ